MRELDIPDQELSALADETLSLAKRYWSRLDGRPAYPATSGEETARLFSRAWAEEGRGRGILADFQTDRRPLTSVRRPVLRLRGRLWRAGRGARRVAGGGSQPECHLLAVGSGGDNDRARRRRLAGRAVGCAGFTGSLCGGGSAANLMALAMAREAKLPANETGAAALRGLRLRAGAHVHSEGRRAAGHRPAAICG